MLLHLSVFLMTQLRWGKKMGRFLLLFTFLRIVSKAVLQPQFAYTY